MFRFIKFYFSKVLKRWWLIIFVIPTIPKYLSEISLFFLGPEHSQNIENTLSLLKPFKSWLIWFVILVYLCLDMKIIYELWKEKENKSPLQDDKLPEKYVNIANKLDILFPSRSINIREKFSSGYRCLTEINHRDINTAICIHFGAYKEIQDFLIVFLRSGNVEITVKMSEIRSKFESNFFQLEEYNNTIGQNKNQMINEHDVQKLIGDINDNLNSLFAHLQ